MLHQSNTSLWLTESISFGGVQDLQATQQHVLGGLTAVFARLLYTRPSGQNSSARFFQSMSAVVTEPQSFCRLWHTLIPHYRPFVSSYSNCIELWEPDLSVCADVQSGHRGGGKRSCRTGIWRASLPSGVWRASVGCPFEWMKPHTGYTGTAAHLMDRGWTESRTRDTCWC